MYFLGVKLSYMSIYEQITRESTLATILSSKPHHLKGSPGFISSSEETGFNSSSKGSLGRMILSNPPRPASTSIYGRHMLGVNQATIKFSLGTFQK